MKTLTDAEVKAIRREGTWRVSDRLYLQVRNGHRSWLFRYQRNGKPCWMGLGSCESVTLGQARAKAVELHGMMIQGLDPLDETRPKRHRGAKAGQEPKVPTFGQCAAQYIEAHMAGWTNDKHIQQWRSTIEQYANPVIGKLPIDEVNVGHLVKILKPIWTTKPETATRLRGRIEKVLCWAQAKRYRSGANPAMWRGGALPHLLPSLKQVKTIKPRRALPYADLPAFIGRLRGLSGDAARCLEFLILTGARSQEARLARWDEIDWDAKCWSIPSERMKMRKPHRVPLADEGIELLKTLPRDREHIFGAPRDADLTRIVKALHDGEGEPPNVHGFRATFRTWCAEQAQYPPHVAERALAHDSRSRVEAAYQRSDFFEQRVPLMADWALFAYGSPVAAEQPAQG